MEMLDFQVSYMNHKAYHDITERNWGLPVRIFFNTDQRIIKYPAQYTNYRHCKPCKRFVSISNQHSKLCRKFPSMNGHIVTVSNANHVLNQTTFIAKIVVDACRNQITAVNNFESIDFANYVESKCKGT